MVDSFTRPTRATAHSPACLGTRSLSPGRGARCESRGSAPWAKLPRRIPGRLAGALCLALFPAGARAALPEVSNVRFQDQESLAWDALGSVAGYHVYSGTIPATGGLQPADCHQGSLRGASTRIEDAPPPGTALYVLVVAFDESEEGPAGSSTSGDPRTIQTHCVPARRMFRFALNGDPGDGGLDGAEPRRNASVRGYNLGSSGQTGVLLHTGEFVVQVLDVLMIGRYSRPLGWRSNLYAGTNRQNLSFPTGLVRWLDTTTGSLMYPATDADGSVRAWTDNSGAVGPFAAFDYSYQVNGQRMQALETNSAISPDYTVEERLVDGALSHRTYQSQLRYDGPLGHTWDFTANARLAPSGQNVLHFDGEGRQEFFFRSGPTSFVSPPGQFSVLIQNPDGSFTLRTPHGTLSNFHAFDGSNLEGALLSVEDRNGNLATWQYDFQGLLTSMTDALGRVITFRYDADGRITEVSDFAGRMWTYSYDAQGDLILVKAPGDEGAAGGRTTKYTYSSGFSDPRLNHNLLSVTRPNEEGAAVPALQNAYGTDPLAFDFDRVVSQTIGGTNASGMAAGGTLTYTYASLNPGGDPFDLSLPRRQAIVLDRNGNEKIFVHNWFGNLLSRTDRTNREARPGEPDYTTLYAHDQDGNLRAVQWPQGNGVVLTYDQPGADRYREGNVLEVRYIPDPAAFGGRGDGRGGDLADRVLTYTYDPVFNGIASLTDERGNDPGYFPQNGGLWSADRYTTRFWRDYQEGDPGANGIAALAGRFGIALGGALFNLGDLNGDGTTLQAAGNAVRIDAPTVLLDPGSRQAAIEGDSFQESVRLISYNHFGQVTALTDAEGNRHEFLYFSQEDPDGDGAETPPPPDGRSLDGTTGGYLRTMILDSSASPGRNNGTDPTPTAIRTDFQYDPRGNLTGLVNGRGVLTVWIRNAANEVVEERRAAATADQAGSGGSPPTGRGEPGLTALDYMTQYEYDLNGRRIASHEEIRDGTRPGAGTTRDRSWIYDILDNVVEIREEVTTGSDRVTEFRYDPNDNPIRRTRPEGNSDEWAWDERDLLLGSTLGASGPRGGMPVVWIYSYDANGNLQTSLDALGGQVDYAYDGFDRRVRRTDEVGGTREAFHDPSSQVVRTLIRGTAGGPTPPDRSGGSNVDLEDLSLQRDERGRVFREDRPLFVPPGAIPARPPVLNEGPALPGDASTNTTYEYDRLSRPTFVTNDMNVTVRADHDGAGQPIRLTDPDGNVVELTYDAGGNVIETAETEHSSVPGPLPETFLTTYFFDALGRPEMVVDNIGRTTRFLYDSLDAIIARTDANGPPGGTVNRRSPGRTGLSVPINGHGNVTRDTYDAPGRLVKLERVLTSTGKGDGTISPAPDVSNPENPDGLLTLTRTWDQNSLPAQLIDDRGNVTTYVHDNLDRLTFLLADDGSESHYQYDVRGNHIGRTDPRGVVITNGHDPAGRITSRTLIPPPGVAGTTTQTFEYDGLSRLRSAFDENSPSGADDVLAGFFYDSLSRLIERSQSISDGSTPRVASLGWTGENRLISLTYPSGREILYDYDPLGRPVSVRDGARPERVDFQYFGGSRIHTQVTHNGLRTTLLDDTGTAAIGFDGAREPVLLRHLDPANNLLAGFEYTYDRAGNRTSERRLHEPGGPGLAEGELYSFDSANRLAAWSEGMLDQNRNLVGPASDLWRWVLDGAGNWATFNRQGVPYRNTPNNLNEYDEPQGGGVRVDDGMPDDFRDLASTPLPDGLNHAHDQAGNQTDTGLYRLQWDGMGRLVEAIRSADGLRVGAYKFDALGNPAESTVTNSGSLDGTLRYFSLENLVTEETDSSGAVSREVIHGPSGYPLWQVLGGGPAQYFLQDASGSTAALASSGFPPQVLVRTTYDPYGKPTFEDANSSPLVDSNGNFLASSPLGNSELWRGTRYDFPELGARTADAQTDLAGLYYLNQPGALNESYSDVFAAMVDVDTVDWLIGEDSYTPGTPGDALRSHPNALRSPIGEGSYNPNEGRSASRNLESLSSGSTSLANSGSFYTAFGGNPVSAAGPFSATATTDDPRRPPWPGGLRLGVRFTRPGWRLGYSFQRPFESIIPVVPRFVFDRTTPARPEVIIDEPRGCFWPRYGTFVCSNDEFGMPTHYFFDPERGFVPRVRPPSMQRREIGPFDLPPVRTVPIPFGTPEYWEWWWKEFMKKAVQDALRRLTQPVF